MHSVHLVDPSNDLVEEACCLWLLHASIGNNVVEELPSTCILHDQIELPSRLYDLVKLNYMRMPDEFENVDLTSNALDVSNLNDPLLLQDLDSNSLPGQNMPPQLNLAKRAFANRLSEHVVADGLCLAASLLLLLLWWMLWCNSCCRLMLLLLR